MKSARREGSITAMSTPSISAICARAGLGSFATLESVAPPPLFLDVTRNAGLTEKTVFGGEKTKKYIIETTGGGVAFVDVAVTRGLTYVPVYVLGFAEAPLFAYVAFVSIQATFIHANVRFRFPLLRNLIATPQFHHWHHSAEREAVDKNFAVHLPVLDALFGTYYMPRDRWPASYGLSGGEPVPPGYTRQLMYPFRRRGT